MAINGLMEKGIIFIIAVLCIAIPVLDFIGALDQVPWISNRIPIYILLSQGSMMMYFLMFSHTSEASQKRRGEKILQSIQSSVQNELITEPIQMHWEQNRLEIERIFELISDYASKPKNRIEDCLEGIYRDIVSGKIPGANSNFRRGGRCLKS